MSIGDDDITVEPGAGGEGVADGGANPKGHDGAPTGRLPQVRVRPTAGRTPAGTTEAPTGRRVPARARPTAARMPKATTAALTVRRSDRG